MKLSANYVRTVFERFLFSHKKTQQPSTQERLEQCEAMLNSAIEETLAIKRRLDFYISRIREINETACSLRKHCYDLHVDCSQEVLWKYYHLQIRMDRTLATYNTEAEKSYPTNRVIVPMTESTVFTGLIDRIRTMCAAYVIAAESGLPFYIYHNAGFKLEDYLIPNLVDWRISKDEIAWGLNCVSFFFYQTKFSLLRPKDKDYHFYQANTVVDNLKNMEELKTKYSDSIVFHKLFKFHPNVQRHAKDILQSFGLQEGKYVAVHARFLNFFEQVEPQGQPRNTTEEEKQAMFEKVRKAIKEIIEEDDKESIILFSDSNTLLSQEFDDYIHIVPGKAGHVCTCSGEDEVTLKTFIDLYVMSKAKAVYSLIGKDLYTSGFSKHAAAIGNIPFIRHDID